MTDRVSLACLGVLALCIIAAIVMEFTGNGNHDAAEIVKLVGAGVTGALAGREVPSGDDGAGYDPSCPECGSNRPMPEPEFGRE